MRKKIKRNALNRGTAVYLGGVRVRYVWACGCTKVEDFKPPAGSIAPEMVARMVRNWRANGVVLPQCRRHPNWESRESQISKLNLSYPQEVVV